MSKVEIISIVSVGMMVLIALRVPLGASMFFAGAVGYGWIVGQGPLLNYLKGLFWARFSVYDLSVIPLFLLMGQFASVAGFSRSLFRAANAWIGWVKGGVAHAAIIACACFGAISGSSVATAATMSQVVLPEMKRLNYSDRLATGTLAAGGTLGILLPPSFILIIYAFLAEQSIIKLFAAAIVPAFLAMILYMASISIYLWLYPEHAPQKTKRASRKEIVDATLEAWPIAAIFLVMFTGIYSGWFTATEGAAVGASSTLLLAIARRKITFKTALGAFLPAAQASAMIYTMLLGAAMMNTALAVSQVPADLSAWANSLPYHPLVIVGGFLVLFVVLSCILDELAMMLLLLPVVLPTILGLDLFGMTAEFKAIWFGILMLVVVSVGLIAPPVGLTVYVVANIAKNVPIGEIYRGIVPFLLSDIVRVLLLLFFPMLTLYLVRFVG